MHRLLGIIAGVLPIVQRCPCHGSVGEVCCKSSITSNVNSLPIECYSLLEALGLEGIISELLLLLSLIQRISQVMRVEPPHSWGGCQQEQRTATKNDAKKPRGETKKRSSRERERERDVYIYIHTYIYIKGLFAISLSLSLSLSFFLSLSLSLSISLYFSCFPSPSLSLSLSLSSFSFSFSFFFSSSIYIYISLYLFLFLFRYTCLGVHIYIYIHMLECYPTSHLLPKSELPH